MPQNPISKSTSIQLMACVARQQAINSANVAIMDVTTYPCHNKG